MKTKTSITIFIFASSYLLPSITEGETKQTKMHNGVKNYKQQNYKEARKLFNEAKKEEPHNPELSYNLANSQFKSGNFDEALQAYNQSYIASTNPKLQQKALYNMGNTLYRMGKLKESIESYIKALEIDSDDMDTKFNLEFTREQLKKKQQRPNSKNHKNSKSKLPQIQKQTSKQGPNNPKSNKNENITDKNNQENKLQGPNNPKSTGKQKHKTSNQTKAFTKTEEETMTPQEAEQWLKTLRENPKLLSQMQRTQQGRNPPYLGKDW